MQPGGQVGPEVIDNLDRLVIERECERLIQLYAFYADHHRHIEMADLFTADGVLDRGNGAVQGKEKIRQALEQRRPDAIVRHISSNVIVDVRKPDQASATSIMTLYRVFGSNEPGQALELPEMVADYHDEFRRMSEGWRIGSRRSVIALRRDP